MTKKQIVLMLTASALLPVTAMVMGTWMAFAQHYSHGQDPRAVPKSEAVEEVQVTLTTPTLVLVPYYAFDPRTGTQNVTIREEWRHVTVTDDQGNTVTTPLFQIRPEYRLDILTGDYIHEPKATPPPTPTPRGGQVR